MEVFDQTDSGDAGISPIKLHLDFKLLKKAYAESENRSDQEVYEMTEPHLRNLTSLGLFWPQSNEELTYRIKHPQQAKTFSERLMESHDQDSNDNLEKLLLFVESKYKDNKGVLDGLKVWTKKWRDKKNPLSNEAFLAHLSYLKEPVVAEE